MSASAPIEDAQLVFDFEEAELENAWKEAFTVKRIGRGIGFCNNHTCDSFLKAAFIFRHEGPFICTVCQQEGIIEAERGKVSGPDNAIIGIIEIEYCFDPSSRRYREKLTVRDEALGTNVRTYTALCPLLNSEKRAIRAAEALLSGLNSGIGPLGDDLPFIPEKTISFDEPLDRVRLALEELELRLKDNPFYSQEAVVSQSSACPELEGETGGSQSRPADWTTDQRPRARQAGAAR